MGRHFIVTAAATAAISFCAAAGAAASAGKSPPHPSSYSNDTSGKKTNTVLIDVVAKNKLTTDLTCGSTYWNSPKLRIEHDRASYDRTTKVYVTDPKTGIGKPRSGHVTFTATYTTAGTFTGTEHLSGTSCHSTRYTAKLIHGSGTAP